MKRKVITVAALLVPLVCGWTQAGAGLVTLDQVIQAALAGGDDSRILEANLAAARAQYGVTVAKNSLALAANAGYSAVHSIDTAPAATSRVAPSSPFLAAGPVGGVTLSGPRTTVSASAYPYIPSTSSKTPEAAGGAVTVSQTVWDGIPGGAGHAAVQKGSLTLQGQELSSTSARLNLLYAIKQTYYTMLNAQRSLAATRENLTRQNALSAQLQVMFNLEQASEVDLQAAQIAAQSAALDVRSGEQSLNNSRVRLSILAGWPADRQFTVAEAGDATIPATTLDSAIADGLSRRPELKQIELNRRSSSIDLELARGSTTPSVSVMGGAEWGFNWTGTATSGGALMAGIRVAMPVLDAGAAKHQEAAIGQQMAVYAAQEDQTRKNIAADISNAFETMHILVDRLAVARLNSQNLDAQYEVTRTKVSFGTATNQDLLTASFNAATARVAAAKASSDLDLAVLQLQSVMGY